jgi:hypothetical protein
MSDYKRFRILHDIHKWSLGYDYDLVRPLQRDFKAGEIVELLEVGSNVLDPSYWTSMEVDGAFIFEPFEVEPVTDLEYFAANVCPGKDWDSCVPCSYHRVIEGCVHPKHPHNQKGN